MVDKINAINKFKVSSFGTHTSSKPCRQSAVDGVDTGIHNAT